MTLPDGVLVAALVAVNAFGDVRDPATGKIVAGARKAPGQPRIRRYRRADEAAAAAGLRRRGNTTLAVVATNARLTKVQATKLAQFASLGMARTIYPVNTMFDGDTVFALSLGEPRRPTSTCSGVAAAEAVAAAILRAVRLARTLGGVPGLA